MLQQPALLLVALLLLLSCSREVADPETEIRTLLDQAEKAVESRSVSQVGQFIAESYRDQKARHRRDILRLLAGYFLSHQTIHLLVQVDSVEIITEQQAQVALYVATAGQSLAEQPPLFSLRADLIRLELSLRRQETLWQLEAATWRRANKQDFLQ
jgi:hypothetical protein